MKASVWAEVYSRDFNFDEKYLEKSITHLMTGKKEDESVPCGPVDTVNICERTDGNETIPMSSSGDSLRPSSSASLARMRLLKRSL